jgi:hypothetical protein
MAHKESSGVNNKIDRNDLVYLMAAILPNSTLAKAAAAIERAEEIYRTIHGTGISIVIIGE